jgi:hypothetical protein
MKKCINFDFCCFLKLLRGMIIISTGFVAWLVLYKIFLIIYKELSLTACMNMFIQWEHLQFFLTAAFGLLTLYVASKQLSKHTDMACINSLIELRKQLTKGTNRDVHFALSLEDDKKTLEGKSMLEESEAEKDKKEKPLNKTMLKEMGLKDINDIPMIDVYNYLGTIELGARMVKQKLMTIDVFYNQFGYRVENIFEGHSLAHDVLRKHINENKPYYKDLFWIYEKTQA